MTTACCSTERRWAEHRQGLQYPYAALLGNQTANDPSGTNLLQVLIHGSHMRTNEGDVFMPAFGHAYTDPELAALADYVIGS